MRKLQSTLKLAVTSVFALYLYGGMTKVSAADFLGTLESVLNAEPCALLKSTYNDTKTEKDYEAFIECIEQNHENPEPFLTETSKFPPRNPFEEFFSSPSLEIEKR
ncbi:MULTISPECIES: hypothetical protein [unclassified Marinovum]